MGTASLMTLDVYSNTSFHPDREYVDGELKERHVGKYEHARLQFLIGAWFRRMEPSWHVQGVTEQRMQVAVNRIRIPDVALLPCGPQPDVILDAPVLVVEILSPDDRYADTAVKIREYLDWGVHTVWVIDPLSPEGQVWERPNSCTFSPRPTVAGTDIYLDLPELLEELRRS